MNDSHIIFNFLRWLEQVCRTPENWDSQRPTCASHFHCCGKEVMIIYFLAPSSAYDAIRHHLRFFQGAGPKYVLVQYFAFFSYSTLSIKDKTGNVFGGLVVDKDVTSPNKSDFYLQSHPGLKGSKCSKVTWHDCLLSYCPTASRPSHYIVLYNKLNFSIDMWVICCV